MSPASSQNCKFNVSRRNILLAGIILAASALATGTLTNVAQAQQQSTVSAGQRPNIVFIMADDVGWLNVGVYN
ncbi:MAG: arylsulfatase, partial [Pseudolabrys sp.]